MKEYKDFSIIDTSQWIISFTWPSYIDAENDNFTVPMVINWGHSAVVDPGFPIGGM